jgi:hypothetical protein
VENVTSAITLLAHMKTTYGVAGAAVTDYSMIAAVEALKSPFLLAVVAAGGLAISMATAAGWVMVLNILMGRDMMGKVMGSPAGRKAGPHHPHHDHGCPADLHGPLLQPAGPGSGYFRSGLHRHSLFGRPPACPGHLVGRAPPLPRRPLTSSL